MFAVPGWSVPSTALKTQTAPAKPLQNGTAPSKEGDGDKGGASKKRKRSSGKSQMKDVNKNNLADMWESVIEGKPKKKKSKIDGEKRQKAEEVLDANIEVQEREGKAMEITKESNTEERIKKGKTKKEKKREKIAKEASNTTDPTSTTVQDAPISAPQPAATKLTPLQASMRQKLISARFRHLNQTLYTTPSAHSLSLFKENHELFNEYHEGFRRQVEVWPENPVDGYIAAIKSRGAIRGPSKGKGSKGSQEEGEQGMATLPLPRTEGCCNIADLGCGDAAISTALQPHLKKLHLKIHSFDLHSPSSLVTKADIASLLLPDNGIDVAIFCLALMGTNWIDFIEEAFRILRWKGELWIAEIKSRFGRVGGKSSKVVEHSVGNRKKNNVPESKEMKKANKRKEGEVDDAIAAVEVDGMAKGEETDVSAFVEVLRKRGFVLKGEGKVGGQGEGVDLRNKMFVRMAFVKGATPVKGKGVMVPKGMEENTGEGAWKRKGKKFLEDAGEEVVGSEAKVLKPCVYKLR